MFYSIDKVNYQILLQFVFLGLRFCHSAGVEIGLDVEVGKQEQIQNPMRQDCPATHLGIVALYEQRLHRVDDEDDELHHLQLGNVALPPEVRLDPRPQRSEEVVAVHDHVDKTVEESAECCVSSPHKLEQGK